MAAEVSSCTFISISNSPSSNRFMSTGCCQSPGPAGSGCHQLVGCSKPDRQLVAVACPWTRTLASSAFPNRYAPAAPGPP